MQDLKTSAAVTVHPSTSSLVQFGPFIFDRANQMLELDGVEISLQPRVISVLDHLLERAGNVVSKQSLMDRAWGEICVGENSLTEAVSQLRQALGDNAQKPLYIQTVHRRGYRFVAPVQVVGSHRQEPREPAENSESGGGIMVRPWRPRTPWIAASALVLLLVFAWWTAHQRPTKPEVAPPLRLDLNSPEGISIPFLAKASLSISPDGQILVFAGRNEAGVRQLYQRSLQDYNSTVIPGTEDATTPEFSPDGREIAFFSKGFLRRVPLSGGLPATLCAAPFALGASWTPDGSIVFCGAFPGGLSIVDQNGGEVRPLTTCNSESGVVGHWWPHVLPDGRFVLYTIWKDELTSARTAVLDLTDGTSHIVAPGLAYARYCEPGRLIGVSRAGIVDVGFDSKNLTTEGEFASIIDQALMDPFVGGAHFAVARNGTMAYLPASIDLGKRQLQLVGIGGDIKPVSTGPRLFRNVRVSPDGHSFAVTIFDDSRSDIWIASIDDPVLNRFTFTGFNIEPRWSPDGSYLLFASNRDGPFNIYRKELAGARQITRLIESDHHQYPQSFSPDGRTLLIAQSTPATGFDIWTLPIEPRIEAPEVLIQTPANEYLPSYSADGRWIAYLGDETGEWEVFVRSSEPGGGLWQVSDGGAGQPFWSPNSAELAYQAGNHIAVAQYGDEPTFAVKQIRQTATLEGIMAFDYVNAEQFIAIKVLSEIPTIDAIRVVVADRH